MKNNKKYIVILLVIIILFVGKNLYDAHQVRSIYEEAINLISKECYEDASDKLQSIAEENYRDTDDLIAYCEANIAYANGNISGAYWDSYSLSFRYQTSEQQENIDTFINKVEQEYDKYCEQKRIEEQKAYELKITSGVPFVGMSENDINRTSLGAPSSEIRHNKECINGKQYTANLYDFYKGSSKVFTARCVQGKVTDVWDHRDAPIPKSSRLSTSGSTKKELDPYDASDYSDPEDFYYDYYDDFWDYEEAEDYWYEYADD